MKKRYRSPNLTIYSYICMQGMRLPYVNDKNRLTFFKKAYSFEEFLTKFPDYYKSIRKTYENLQ